MIKRVNHRSISFLLVSFVLLSLGGSVGFAADSQLAVLYTERAAIIEKIDLLLEKVQGNVDRLRPKNREYLLFQGSINFAEDEKSLSDFYQKLKETEKEIIGLLKRENLPLPAWVSQTKQETIYTGAPPFSFYHPLVARFASQETLPVTGTLVLFVLWGGLAVVFLYGSIRKIFPRERGALYPCLLTLKENGGLEPLYIPFALHSFLVRRDEGLKRFWVFPGG